MRGITHFMMGITALTFIKSFMLGAQLEDSVIIVIGGIFGLLPDTLDFKFLLYIETHDLTIDPDPHDMRPQEIADKLAGAINRAGELKPGKMVKVNLHTLKLGPDLWQSYSLYWDTKNKQVVVRIGPHVSMVGTPFWGTEPPADKAVAVAKFKPKLIDRHGEPSEIKGFGGPSFGFLKNKDGSVEVVFIPFHRRSGHSLTLGALFALIGYLLSNDPLIALAIFLPWSLHILIDSYGHMGGNLFWPVQKQRSPGFYLVTASNPFWNAFTVYSCMALILWNMNLYNLPPYQSFSPAEIPIWLYLFLVIVIPWSIVAAIVLIYRARVKEEKLEIFPPIASVGAAAAAGSAEEAGGDAEAEHLEAEERVEQQMPPFIIRSLGLIILAVIFVLLFHFGPSL